MCLILLLELIIRLTTRLDNVRDERDQAWAEAAFGHQTILYLLNTDDLIFLDHFRVQRQVVIQVTLWLEQLHADVDILVRLLKVVLNEHSLKDDLCVSLTCIEAQLIIEDHYCFSIVNVSTSERFFLLLISF